MVKKTFNINRSTARMPKIRPAAKQGWYKRFRQLMALVDKRRLGLFL